MTVTVTNIEHRPDGSPWTYGRVTVAVAGPTFDANGAQLVGATAKLTDATGAASFPGLVPGVTYVWTSPDRSQTYFTPTVADGGTQNLASCAGAPVTGNVQVAASAAQVAAAVAAEASRAQAAEQANAAAITRKADLVGGLVPRAQLPNISGTYATTVANQAAMLALVAPDPDTLLIAIRADTPGTQWLLNPGQNPTVLGNWIQAPADGAGAAAAVQSNLTAEVTRATNAEQNLSTQLGTTAAAAAAAQQAANAAIGIAFIF